jgi:conjugative relaxase-like TrwC/TraI family protein
MSIHKLSAGSGYDYLTRQVAALDATEKGHVGLASYYTERGESPGRWVGSGMAGIDGLNAGDAVTAEQMRSLFGAGMHPLATQRLEQLDATELTDTNARAATQLGLPFKVYSGEVSAFRVEVAKRIAARQPAAGQLRDGRISATDRALVRTEVAREFFRNQHGRDPIDAREIAAIIAKGSRPRTQTVAGYDLTFSPVKSVSSLWAVADPHVAALIEQAHQAAVQDALAFIECYALFTRQGRNGVRQVNVTGLVAAAFTHRDSRAGDPDLHTHVAVANKVQTLDGRWLSIDGRVLFKATVAASETYNTALEHHLRGRLGVRFADRPDTDPGKRPVREIVGIDPALNQRWSSRRILIKERQGELAARFQRDHGRPPTPVEALQLAQQATLETRDAKHEPRSLTEQRTTWHAEAVETLGGPDAVQAMINKTLNPISIKSPAVDGQWVTATAEKVLAALEEHRSTWQSWHVRAEAIRHLRGLQVGADKVDQLVDLLVKDVFADPISGLDWDRGQHQGAGGATSGRRFQRVYGVRIGVLQLSPDFGRRAPTDRDCGPHRRPGRGREHGRACAAGVSRQRERLRCRAGCFGSCRLYLWGAAAARDRPGWRRQDHRDAHPGLGVERQWWPGNRVGPVGRRSCAAPRRHRRTSRNVGETHLVY